MSFLNIFKKDKNKIRKGDFVECIFNPGLKMIVVDIFYGEFVTCYWKEERNNEIIIRNGNLPITILNKINKEK